MKTPIVLDEPLMSLDGFSFSPYGASSLTPSPVNRMMAAFAVDFRDGYDINLGVGYANEQTIPRKLIGEMLDTVVQTPKNTEPHSTMATLKGRPIASN